MAWNGAELERKGGGAVDEHKNFQVLKSSNMECLQANKTSKKWKTLKSKRRFVNGMTGETGREPKK